MNGLLRFVGAIVLVFYFLAWLNVVDFYLCVGKVGSCTTRSTTGAAMKRHA